VLALTLPGHAGGPAIREPTGTVAFVDALESALDDVGFAEGHIAGNSLGGWLALQLAARGRAWSVVALAPAGGWAAGDESYRDLLRMQLELVEQTRAAAPGAQTIVSSAAGRRRATALITANFEHIPAELIAHQLLGIAACGGANALIENGLREGWSLDASRIHCPVRIVWGTEDRLLPWPTAAARYQNDWLPHADWVVLDGVGHCPQLDVPLEAAQLILGLTSG
jgi:pimeloyl-ACP methyl ester carboxylesterase